MPKSNIEFWKNKLEGNVARDQITRDKLETLGWRVQVVWECEVKALIENNSGLRDMITKEKMA